MSNIPTWHDVENAIQPIAKNWIQKVKENLENAGYEVSDVGKTEPAGGIGWDITVTAEDGSDIVITFEVVDSREYEEGEMLGYNVSIDAVHEDGRILADHTPYNYTKNAWTTNLDQLKRRAKEMPEVPPHRLE